MSWKSISQRDGKWLVSTPNGSWWASSRHEAETMFVGRADDPRQPELCRNPGHPGYMLPVELCRHVDCAVRFVHAT